VPVPRRERDLVVVRRGLGDHYVALVAGDKYSPRSSWAGRLTS